MKKALILILLILAFRTAYGQVFGPSIVTAGATATYYKPIFFTGCGNLTSVNISPIGSANIINSSFFHVTIQFGCQSPVTISNGSCNFTVTVIPYTLSAAGITGPVQACKNSTYTYITPSLAGAAGYEWNIPGQGLVTTSVPSISITWNISGNVTLSVTPVHPGGCPSNSSSLPIFVQDVPGSAGPISGPTLICGGSNAVYSISPAPNATSYDWQITAPGAVITSIPPYSNAITVSFPLYASSGSIAVTPVNDCGNGVSSQKNITVNTLPGPTQPVFGPASVCQGATNVTYYTTPVFNANSYNWTVTGGVITGGLGTPQITVNWPASGPGTVIVTPSNIACGSGQTQSINVTVHPIGPPATTSAVFNHSELSIPVSKQLLLNTCTGATPCVSKVIDKAELNILLNTGADYEYGKNSFNTAVEVEVIGWDNVSGTGNQIVNYRQQLQIDESAPEQLFNIDFTPQHPLIHRFEVILHNYNPDPVVSDNIRLEVFYTEVFKYDVHSTSPLITSVTTVPPIAGVNRRTFSWTACEKFPNYEFQLLRLFNNNPANTTNQTVVQANIDWNKALTIETQSSATSITISVVEGTGYYVWRVRPIGNYYEGDIANNQNWGAWSATPSFNQGNTVQMNFGSGTSPYPYVFYYTQFDEDLNFIYSRFFAEEGKIKESITYANGLLQVQQNQVYLESQNDVVVSQTVMDFTGRPALSSLPVPVNNKVSLGYEPLFMKNALSGGLYTAEDFDADANYQNPEAVSSTAGSNFDYYSANNSDIQVPNAEGYPYSRTRFYSNGVNQVKESGGPGETHRIKNTGASRTQRTLYSGVADAELIRIFGDEAPSSKSVHKVISIDANNVASVSYISKEGNAIATCLSINGINPLLDPLPSQANAAFSVADTLTGDIPYGPTGTQTSTTVAFVEPTTIRLHYEITAATIEDLCLEYCTTCDYKIEFIVQNVDDPLNPPLFVEKLLPPDICSNPVSWDTVITLTLNPGMYTISRRVLAANVNPATTGGTALPQTYLEQHLDSLSAGYDSLFQDSLGWIYTYLDSAWIEQLYDSLGIDINVPNPDLVFNDSLVYVSIGCDSFPLPIIVCPKNPCPPAPGDFVQYFIDRWAADYPSIVIPDGSGRYPFLNNDYSNQELSNMIDAMIANGYSCDSLWICWEQIVQNYAALSDMASNISGYTFNLVNEFLNCTGRRIIGYSNTASGPTGYIEMAFQYFQYNPGDITLCEDFACGTGGCAASGGFISASTSFTPQQWMDLYHCVTNAQPGQPFDPGQAAQANTDSCKVVCENRRDGFINSIIRMFHNDSLYVEGDTTYLVRDDSWGQQFIVGITPLPAGHTYDVSWKEVECLANSLVERCKQGCQLTTFINPITGDIDSVGSQAEIFAMAQSMTFAYELELPDDSGNCPPDFELIAPGLFASGALTPATLQVEWDSIYGGTIDDYLLDIKQTTDGGFILVGSSNSPAATTAAEGNKTDPAYTPGFEMPIDYWIIKIDADGNHVWDNDLHAKDYDILYSVAQTTDGGYILGGASPSENLGPVEKTAPKIGQYDYWLVKLDANGISQWQQTYGGVEDDFLMEVQQTPDGGYILTGYTEYLSTGGFGSRDGLVIKVDQNGAVQWQKILGSSGADILIDALQTADGGYLFAGASNGGGNPAGGKTDPSFGSFDMWLVKTDAGGNIQWNKTIGGASEDLASDILQTPDGGFAVAGLSQSSPGTGNKTAPNYGGSDYWLVKLDAAQQIQWDQSYGGIYHDAGDNDQLIVQKFVKMVRTPDGNYFLGGSSMADGLAGASISPTKSAVGYGNVDFWTVYTDPQGNYLWDKAWGGTMVDNFNAIIQTNEGGYAIAGHSNSHPTDTKSQYPFGYELHDYWVIRISDTTSCDHRNICFRWVEWPNLDSLTHVFEPWTCEKITADALRTALDHLTYEYKKDRLDAFEADYLNTCANPDSIQDKFWVEYPLGYHHYTLYYYDRAGNLIKTVPPKGVDLLDISQPIVLQRKVQNNHTFITDYQYNSIKQLMRQNTPDGNETRYYYNRIGQLRFSQNAKQALDGTYSYTKYDPLGRIIEIGQSTQDVANISTHTENPVFPILYNNQRTWTIYSISIGLTYLDDGVSLQRYLQNRVSYTLFDEDGDLSTAGDRVITSYSYDPHGNVEWLAQDIPGLGRQYVAYTYDLVSGNVLQVKYNEGRKDQFYHRYGYDADNRITLVETSPDGKLWDKDGSYSYYKHGPLRRMNLGEDKLQGIDYTYTIHGWLKAVNHASLAVANDPGADNQSNRFAPDAFGMQLNYFTGDFNRTGSVFHAGATDALNPATNHDLFNGNISTWASNTIPNPAGLTLQYEQLSGNQYRYDELNRIKKSDFKYFTSGWNATDDYNTRYSYDANGNIDTLIRNGYAAQHLLMDSLFYAYTPLTNQLDYVKDPVTANNYSEDIDAQNPGNYDYDPIGQLTRDDAEEIAQIEWTVYGKIKSITRIAGSTRPALRFRYDASGNRIKKEVINDPTDPTKNNSTYYVRDASGNVMAIYEENNAVVPTGYIAHVHMAEQPIYGSDRLGQRRDSIPVKSTLYPSNGGTPINVSPGEERIAEERSLMFPYSEVITLTWGSWSFTFNIGGKIDLDVSTATAVAGTPAPVYGNMVQGTHINRTEDRYGNLLFSNFTSKTYQGNANVCFVLDASGQPMPGAAGILSNAVGNSVSMKAPASADQYYLFTVGTDGRLYYHIIDLSQPGNGTTATPLGEVVSINNTVNGVTSYGKTMALLEDHTGNANSQLYLRKYLGANTAALVRFEVNAAGVGPEQTMTTYSSIASDNAEMQLSPDGMRLALTNTYRTGTFFSIPRGRILTYDLSPDHTAATLANVRQLGWFTYAGSLDFSPDGGHIYFSQSSAFFPTANGLFRYNYNTAQQQLLSAQQGKIRRAYNGNMYLAWPNALDVLEIQNPDGAYTLSTVNINPFGIGRTTGGVQLQEHRIYPADTTPINIYTRLLDKKWYELKDHLGNVRVTLGDVKLSILDGANAPIVSSFKADVKSSGEYYAGGGPKLGRSFNLGSHRYGHNGQESDPEISGSWGNHYTAGYWMMDSRILRRWNTDPVVKEHESPYAVFANNPIWFVDPMGADTGDVVVAFGGGDWMMTGDQGDSAPAVVNLIKSNNFNERGGEAQSFSSDFVGVDPSNTEDLNNATQKAYDFIIANYDAEKGGKISLYGYSFGGVMATHLASRLNDTGYTVDMLVTVDAAGAWKNSSVSREIPSNVAVNVNFYQTKGSMVGSYGGKNTATGSTTKIYNVNMTGMHAGETKVEHGTIDDFTIGPAAAEMLNIIMGTYHFETTSKHKPQPR